MSGADVRSRLMVATANAGKLVEWRVLLSAFALDVHSAADDDLLLPEENGASYVANAAIKAVAGALATHGLAIGDDTGLCVPSLGGEPGLATGPWAASCGGWPAAYEQLAARTGVRERTVRASLHCAVVLADATGGDQGDGVLTWSSEAIVHGSLRWPPSRAAGPAAMFEPDTGVVVEHGVLIHRRLAFESIVPQLRQRLMRA